MKLNKLAMFAIASMAFLRLLLKRLPGDGTITFTGKSYLMHLCGIATEKC